MICFGSRPIVGSSRTHVVRSQVTVAVAVEQREFRREPRERDLHLGEVELAVAIRVGGPQALDHALAHLLAIAAAGRARQGTPDHRHSHPRTRSARRAAEFRHALPRGSAAVAVHIRGLELRQYRARACSRTCSVHAVISPRLSCPFLSASIASKCRSTQGSPFAASAPRHPEPRCGRRHDGRHRRGLHRALFLLGTLCVHVSGGQERRAHRGRHDEPRETVMSAYLGPDCGRSNHCNAAGSCALTRAGAAHSAAAAAVTPSQSITADVGSSTGW